MVPEREVEDGGETEIERDRGRKLKWSQWCGTIVVAWLSGAACDWFVDRVLPLSYPLSFSISTLRVSIRYRLSFFHTSYLLPLTFSYLPPLSAFAQGMSAILETQTDVFDSRV